MEKIYFTKELYTDLHRHIVAQKLIDVAIPICDTWGQDKELFAGKEIVDAGCGGMGAQTIQLIKANAKRVWAVDLSEENIISAQKNFNEQFSKQSLEKVIFKTANLANLSFLPNNSVDIVLCRGVFQHILDEDKHKVLNEFFRILRVNGYLLISVYGKGGWLAFVSNLLRGITRFVPFITAKKILGLFLKGDVLAGTLDHLYVPNQTRYTKENFISLLQKGNFRNIEEIGNLTFDLKSLNIKYHIFDKIWYVYLNPISKNKIKLLSLILFGKHGVQFKAQKRQ